MLVTKSSEKMKMTDEARKNLLGNDGKAAAMVDREQSMNLRMPTQITGMFGDDGSRASNAGLLRGTFGFAKLLNNPSR